MDMFFSELYLQNPFEACESEQPSKSVWSAYRWDELLNSCQFMSHSETSIGQLEQQQVIDLQLCICKASISLATG